MITFLKKDPYVFVVLLIALLAGWWLLRPGYFNIHDDLQMMRQLAMEKCFADFQIPCRWTQYMGYGYGFPLFNFYPPLPYLVGEVFRLFQFSFVTTVKLTFLLSFLISGVTMYIFAREFFGRLGGLVSATFYIWAPYHSVDIYVRGAMNEAWSLVWLPLILWASYRLIKSSMPASGPVAGMTGPVAGSSRPTSSRDVAAGARRDSLRQRHPSKWIVTLALAWFALLTSHNLMVLIFTPLFLSWLSIWILKYKSWRSLPNLTISGVWAFGLAAFFTLPVFLEQKLVHVETLTQGYYEYVAHFANIRQLLTSRFWGYGPSAWADADDKMAFSVGQIHWILASILIIWLAVKLIRREKLKGDWVIVSIFFFLAGWFATFMSHVKSTFIWQQIPPLLFVQFPWRFLTLAVLSFSGMVGASAVLLRRWIVFGLIAGVVGWNWQFFKPERMGALTDQEKFSGAAWDLQQTAGIYDYLPKDASTAPKAPQKSVADVVSGKGQISDASQGSNWAKFKVIQDEDNGKVRINIFKFPGWKVFIDGRQVQVSTDNDEWGRMHIDVPKGEYVVTARLYNTPARTVGNFISLISWGGIFALGALTFKRKKQE
ncbi:MAG: hypothetical protein A2782_02750 [Candidatus Blackburnbacteria bacterium RIFCSPHIGHO2_01_FULL_43_15b]|uniref:Membrane protein 6-pyruvoyl-tetrahydropterin synthase-related domain-containing protein n=1 Tax=Candidatus Blackburnbacteria bacterium RIFCSPHIGHO2_01_FULL_43_15b TaxID=1797513 RepID=A0A1G1V2Y0_9BACT|nr:MAG: hypothetical protein A2782_02750 [Candidatus Blackburnbacteria bacterium RIFCSPHIGHO2_01_FULL_43_15b]